MKQNKQSAFTIVELLIVIVVIGILAALVLNSFTGAQDKAREAKQQNDMEVLAKAISAARINKGAATVYATSSSGKDCVDCTCRQNQTAGDDLNNLPKSTTCWVNYLEFIDRLALAAETNLDGLKAGNPWGAPYFVDLNEDVNGACTRDTVTSSGKDGRYDAPNGPNITKTDPYDIRYSAPNYKASCL